MLKQTITGFFDNYQTNQIKDNVPRCEFKPNRHPFDYLPPERIVYKDLRQQMKANQTEIDRTEETITDMFSRYMGQFQFRKSYQSRIISHTLQYTMTYGLIIFGFYSKKLSGINRFKHVMKQTLKTALYSGSIFTMNEAIFPFVYKLRSELNQKPMFTTGNLLSSMVVWPLVFALEWDIFISIRKALFICAYGQIRDYQTQNQRFYRLNPGHLSTLSKIQTQRIKHPFQDPFKRLLKKNSRAQQQRQRQQQQALKIIALQNTKGQRIPSTHLYMIMPEIYRPPTQEQKKTHEQKAMKKTQQILDQRGITWISAHVSQDKDSITPAEGAPQVQVEGMEIQKKEKKSWLPW